MSHLTSLLSKPSTLGLIAVGGSGAFYLGLKSKTIMAQQAQRDSGGENAASGADGQADEGRKNFEVKAGREGGGV